MRDTNLQGVPFLSPGVDLVPGERYHRVADLADQGGVWQKGIITSRESPYVFLVYSDRGHDFGYEDEFVDDGSFIYTGMGGEGDMEWNFENRSIRDHRELDKELHLFEKDDEPYMASHVGQFEYDSYFMQELPDREGEMRKAIRFRLRPAGGTDIGVPFDPAEVDAGSLYDAANAAAVGRDAIGGHEAMERYPRSEVVKRFARRIADGTCLGCEEPAPFAGEDGKPFLEVHHLRRRADGGADRPENVVALCPNCHRRVHHSPDGNSFNQDLKTRAEEEYRQFESR